MSEETVQSFSAATTIADELVSTSGEPGHENILCEEEVEKIEWNVQKFWNVRELKPSKLIFFVNSVCFKTLNKHDDCKACVFVGCICHTQWKKLPLKQANFPKTGGICFLGGCQKIFMACYKTVKFQGETCCPTVGKPTLEPRRIACVKNAEDFCLETVVSLPKYKSVARTVQRQRATDSPHYRAFGVDQDP